MENNKINTKQYNKLMEFTQPDHTFLANFISEPPRLVKQQFEIILHTITPVHKLNIPQEYQDKFEILIFPHIFMNMRNNDHILYGMQWKDNIKQVDYACYSKMCNELYYQQFMLLILEEFYK